MMRELATAARPPSAAQRVSALGALWRFTRPHTVTGTTVSVLCLAVIAGELGAPAGAFDVAAAVVAALLVNIAIVGINQVEDVELDRVNKPSLPLAAGELSVGRAQAACWISALIAVGMAFSQGPIELVAVAGALAIGIAYSVPPLQLKRFAFPALASITIVRAFAVNLGVYGHFAGSLDEVPGVIWALTGFTIPFGAAIAALKDVPDIEGDRAFGFRTFSVRFSPRIVFRLAVAWLAVSYLAMASVGPVLSDEVNVAIFSVGHLGLAALFLSWARNARPENPSGFTAFYMRVWLLFFCEYALVTAAVVL